MGIDKVLINTHNPSEKTDNRSVMFPNIVTPRTNFEIPTACGAGWRAAKYLRDQVTYKVVHLRSI